MGLMTFALKSSELILLFHPQLFREKYFLKIRIAIYLVLLNFYSF